MRPITFTVALLGGILVSCTAFAAGEACLLIAQTQVSAALEIPVNPGTPISSPSTCQWIGKGRFATLTIMQPLAGKSPRILLENGSCSVLQPLGGPHGRRMHHTGSIF